MLPRVTLITNTRMADGIGRQGIGLLQCIKEDISCNVLHTLQPDFRDISKDLQQLLQVPFSGYGDISFWTYILGLNEGVISQHQKITSKLKIAYSMFESDAIPSLWTRILNSFYDMVLVPDIYLVGVYRNSGVKIPIGVLPLGIMIEPFLNQPVRICNDRPFIFGMSAGFWFRKNHLKLIEAFKVGFGNNRQFELRLHGRFGSYQNEVKSVVASCGLNNVRLISDALSNDDYLKFMSELDCYVFPSMGEGYSITPREALALGKPCVITDNSVHHSLIEEGIVFGVKSDKIIPAKYEVFGNQVIGNFFDCSALDLAETMKYVVGQIGTMNLDYRLQMGREKAQNYSWNYLKKRYLQLFKPSKIEYLPDSGSKFIQIFDDKLITNDSKLLKKYQFIYEIYNK